MYRKVIPIAIILIVILTCQAFICVDTKPSTSENFVEEQSQIEQIDSSQLIGTWRLAEKDAHGTELWYVGNLPKIFWIDTLEQVNNELLKVRTEKGSYSFFITTFSSDSSILFLHPAICKCEGLEIEYQKERISN